MKVAIDLMALLPKPTGVDRYLRGLVAGLAELDRESEYLLIVNAEDRHLFRTGAGAAGGARARPTRGGLAGDGPPADEGHQLPDNFRVLPLSRRSRLTRLVVQQIVQPTLLRALRVDVLHSGTFIMPLYRAGRGHVLTIHDMSSFLLPDKHPSSRRGRLYELALAQSIRRADIVSVPAPSVKRDILAILPTVTPDKVRVIRAGIDARFAPRTAAESALVVERLGIRHPYVLYVGTLDPRKNLPRLIDGYVHAVRDGGIAERLVLAGQPGWNVDELLAGVERSGLKDRIHLVGYVAPDDLPALYAGARLFVFPSLQEGFGFPPLEAMASGVPVVAADSSALKDNLAGAAELVEATDAAALASAMARLLRDDRQRAELIAKGLARAAEFSWDRFARDTQACYRELVASSRRVR